MPMKKYEPNEDGRFGNDTPDSEEVSVHMQAVLEAIAEERSPLEKLKERLPMFYTARGNIIKRKARAITGKSFGTHRRVIDQLNERGNHLVVVGDGWTLKLDIATSDLLRDFEQVEGLYLAGWEISLI
jgi:hypothetical protein